MQTAMRPRSTPRRSRQAAETRRAANEAPIRMYLTAETTSDTFLPPRLVVFLVNERAVKRISECAALCTEKNLEEVKIVDPIVSWLDARGDFAADVMLPRIEIGNTFLQIRFYIRDSSDEVMSDEVKVAEIIERYRAARLKGESSACLAADVDAAAIKEYEAEVIRNVLEGSRHPKRHPIRTAPGM
jgi:hypothetical protein